MSNELSRVPIPSVSHPEVTGFPPADCNGICIKHRPSLRMCSPAAPLSACQEPQALHSSRNLSDRTEIGDLHAGAPGGPWSRPCSLGYISPPEGSWMSRQVPPAAA